MRQQIRRLIDTHPVPAFFVLPSLDQWATIRTVTADTVKSNVNASREKLLADEDREQDTE